MDPTQRIQSITHSPRSTLTPAQSQQSTSLMFGAAAPLLEEKSISSLFSSEKNLEILEARDKDSQNVNYSRLQSYRVFINDIRFKPEFHNPNIGTIQSNRGVATCVLLDDGRILTNLHNIFDVKKYFKAGSNQSSIDSLQKKDNIVDQYFDNRIELYFFDRGGELQYFIVENIVDGIRKKTHMTGLPLMQSTISVPSNWDIAILDLSNLKLNQTLGIKGFKLPPKQSFMPACAPSIPQLNRYAAPHYNSEHIWGQQRDDGSNQWQLLIKSRFPNKFGYSGNVSTTPEGIIYSMVFSAGHEIDISAALFDIEDYVYQPNCYRPLYWLTALNLEPPVMDVFLDVFVIPEAIDFNKMTTLDIFMQTVRTSFYSAFRDNISKSKGFFKIKIDNITAASNSLHLIVDFKCKYLAGIEFTSKEGKAIIKIGTKLLKGKSYTMVEDQYPSHATSERWKWINKRFSLSDMQKLCNQINLNNYIAQNIFDYFIQVIEMAKMPVIEKIISKLDGKSLNHHDSFALDEIMKATKRNYGKLSDIAVNKEIPSDKESKPSSLSQFIRQLSDNMFIKSGNKIISFIYDTLLPILNILEQLTPEVKAHFGQLRSSADEETIVGALSKYEDCIKNLFTPAINNNWYPVFFYNKDDYTIKIIGNGIKTGKIREVIVLNINDTTLTQKIQNSLNEYARRTTCTVETIETAKHGLNLPLGVKVVVQIF